MTNHQYSIHAMNIIRKLLNAIITSRLTLVWKEKLSWILIWFFFVVFFQVGKEKRIANMLSHYYESIKLHFHLPFQQSSYKCCSSKFEPFFIKTHHWTFTILKFSFCSFVTTSHCVFPIHIGTRKGSWGFTKTKSPFGCMPSKRFQTLWPTIRTHDWVFCISILVGNEALA